MFTVRRIVNVIGRRNSVSVSIINIKNVIKKESPDFLMKIEYFSDEINDKKTLDQEMKAKNKVNSGIPNKQMEKGMYLKIHKDRMNKKMLVEEK